MGQAALELPQCPQIAIYRAAVRLVRDNRTLSRVVRRWVVWDGSDDDLAQPTPDQCPWVELAPSIAADEHRGPADFESDLIIRLSVATAGTRSDDLINLYHALRRAFYPKDATERAAAHVKLIDAGALTGEALFDSPSLGVLDGDEDDGAPMLAGRGTIRLGCRLLMNP